MKKILPYLITGVAFLFLCISPIAAQSSGCTNGGFEAGDFSGWAGKYGERDLAGIPFDDLYDGFSPGYHTLTSPGYDPNIGGTLLPTVSEGNHAIRIGDYNGGLEASVISYNFIVSPANVDFSFKYAMVMQDGNVNIPHIGTDNSYFGYYLMVIDGLFTTIIDSDLFIADETDPFFNVTSGWVWRDWSQKCYDLQQYMGKKMLAVFYVADCVHGAHGAYAYIDGLCSDNGATAAFDIPDEICLGDPLIADGSPSTNEDNHFWSIQASGADWVAIGPEYSQWFPAEQAGTIDLNSFINAHGGSLECNTYYRVKLAVSSECTPWHAETKLIYVRCPDVEELPDLYFCCDEDPDPVTIGPLGDGLTYKWKIFPAGSLFGYIEYGETIEIVPSENMRIIVEVTDTYGCTSKHAFNIYVFGRYEVEIHYCCNNKLNAEITFLDEGCGSFYDLSPAEQAEILSQLEFSWSNGDTGSSTVVTTPGVYTVEVTGLNPCMDASDSYIFTGLEGKDIEKTH